MSEKISDDPLMDAVNKGTVRYTSFPLTGSVWYPCATERHNGQRITASIIFMIYEPDVQSIIKIHQIFAECKECNDLKQL